MSSYSSDATAPWLHVIYIASITILIASSVERPGLLPIWPSGSSYYSSAALTIRLHIAVSITFPNMLRSAIGRYAPGVLWALIDLPAFRNTTTSVRRNRLGKYFSLKLALVNFVIIRVSGSL